MSTALTDLQNALLTGGTIKLQFDGVIATSTPLVISVNNTVLDATGRNVTISGSGSSRVFEVLSNITFTATNLVISGGRVAGTNGVAGATGSSGSDGGAGGNGTSGGTGFGGAIRNLGTARFIGCLFVTNQAAGGTGGSGGNGGNGSFQGGSGGNGGAGGGALGGGLYNLGSLFLSNCTFAGNDATAGNGGNGGTNGSGTFAFPGSGGAGGVSAGGAIYNLGTVTVVNSTFNQNSAEGGSSQQAGGAPLQNGDGAPGLAGGFGAGAGVFNRGTLRFLNCTFFNNVSVGGNGANGANTSDGFGAGGTGGNGGAGWGGSVYTESPGLVTFTNCTFLSDAVIGGAGGAAGTGVFAGMAGAKGQTLGASLANNGGTIALKNSVLGAATNGALGFGVVTDQGNNVSFGGTPPFSTTNSFNNTNPLLTTLGTNGGPTLTIALAPGSPAIDRVFDNSAPPFDQRGFARPAGARSDSGAFEFGVAATNFTLGGTVTLGGAPLAGAVVNAGTFSTKTDSNGGFSFSIAAGSSVTVSPQPLNFFKPSSSNVTLSSNTNISFVGTNALGSINATNTNSFQITFAPLLPTLTYRIQASTNLSSSNWVTIFANISGTNLSFMFITNSTNPRTQFFRAIAP